MSKYIVSPVKSADQARYDSVAALMLYTNIPMSALTQKGFSVLARLATEWDKPWAPSFYKPAPKPTPEMLSSLVRYLIEGVLPGHFLSALLANDVAAAVDYADSNNLLLLTRWVRIIQLLPVKTRGSWKAVTEWKTNLHFVDR